MFEDKLFLMGLGVVYGMINILGAFFAARQTFRLVNKYANRIQKMYTLKIIGIFLCILVFFTIFTLISMISAIFPINDSLWEYFSGSSVLAMFFTLLILFGRNKKL
ncbi:hypothetical protein [Acinetobacter populi]|uniref:hypothetical protein n=1 Tax=Acinetobacter populi TaxID=1582270 RepID=UPI0011208AC9|nr:hypothetical protein [Acinetobacter populi]